MAKIKRNEVCQLKELKHTFVGWMMDGHNPDNYSEEILEKAVQELSRENLRYNKKEGCLFKDTIAFKHITEGFYKRYPVNEIPNYDLAYDIFEHEFLPYVLDVAKRLQRLKED